MYYSQSKVHLLVINMNVLCSLECRTLGKVRVAIHQAMLLLCYVAFCYESSKQIFRCKYLFLNLTTIFTINFFFG